MANPLVRKIVTRRERNHSESERGWDNFLFPRALTLLFVTLALAATTTGVKAAPHDSDDGGGKAMSST